MDTGAYEVRRGERRIELTRTEFSLLRLLLEHPRQVLTRSLILERVWGYDFGASSNSLEVYVGYLRRKLEAGGEPRLVHTVRGVGYVLREPPPAMSFRRRIALASAAAVAMAVVLASAVVYLVVRDGMRDQVDSGLRELAKGATVTPLPPPRAGELRRPAPQRTVPPRGAGLEPGPARVRTRRGARRHARPGDVELALPPPPFGAPGGTGQVITADGGGPALAEPGRGAAGLRRRQGRSRRASAGRSTRT